MVDDVNDSAPTSFSNDSGVVGVYAARGLERGYDFRLAQMMRRSDRETEAGWPAVGPRPVLPMNATRATKVGRGAKGGKTLEPAPARPVAAPGRQRSPASNSHPVASRRRWGRRLGWSLAARHRMPTERKTRVAVAAIVAVVTVVGFASQAFANTVPAASPALSAPPSMGRYVVRAGDTLEGLADRFGVETIAIVIASDLGEPPTIAAEQVILIPAPGRPVSAAVAVAESRAAPLVVDAHRVADGETLARIATEYGTDAGTLAAFNGIDDPDLLRVDQRLLIPAAVGGGNVLAPTSWEATMMPVFFPGWEGLATGLRSPGGSALPDLTEVRWAVPPGEEVGPPRVFVPNVPNYVQRRNLSCEYASVYIATSAYGMGIPEAVFYDSVVGAANPHVGYRGNIDGEWGNTTDYGVYPEPLLPILDVYGFRGEVLYAFGDTDVLRQRLDAGQPVIVWLGYWGDTRERLADAGSYSLASGIHVVVAYGYDDDVVHISNPATGQFERIAWPDFTEMWSVLDGMGLAVVPE